MSALRRLHGSAASVVGAVLLVLVVASIVLYNIGSGRDSDALLEGARPLVDDAYAALTVGTRRDRVEDRVGRGQDALEYRYTGVATEPLDAECRYFPGSNNLRDVVQLCYRNDRLASKRRYPATAGPPLYNASS